MLFEEILRDRYPKQVALEDGTQTTIRAQQAEDKDRLLRFFRAVPERDRMFLADDVTDERVVERWIREADFSLTLPLLAVLGGEVVGDATLHRQKGGWMEHVGRVRVVVHPDYRGKGIAALLVKELMEIAVDIGLATLDAEFMPEQQAAMRRFEQLGFVKIAELPGHVLDRHGAQHDLVILSCDLQGQETFAGD